MKVPEKNGLESFDVLEFQQKALHRRDFLRYTGFAGTAVAAGSLLGLASCKDSDSNDDGVNFGSGDVAILNYAYALEQLEAAFYTQLIATPFSGMSGPESSLLKDIRDHEVAHREFFKAVLGADAIQNLEVDFSSINFASRDSVLNTAKAFEDLGVSAYNGAGRYLANGTYLLLAGKIVSVEARHAAYIRDLLQYGSFADSSIVNGDGLEVSRKPRAVIDIAKTYIRTKLNTNSLPA